MSYDIEQVGIRDIITIIEGVGDFKATLSSPESSVESLTRQKEIAHWRRKFIISLFFALPTLLIGMIFGEWVSLTKHWLMETTVYIDNLSVMSVTLFFLATPVQFWLGMLPCIAIAANSSHFCRRVILYRQLQGPTTRRGEHGCAHCLGH